MRHPTYKLFVALLLSVISTVVNAGYVPLLWHYRQGQNLITDGSHSLAGPTTVFDWDWDGTTLTGTGLYSAVSSIGGLSSSSGLYADQILNPTFDTSTGTVVASATSYSCLEGTFGFGVEANICGHYNFGADHIDDSAVNYGPGTAASRTLGGDDIALGPMHTIEAYDYGYFHSTVITTYDYIPEGLDWITLVIGNGIPMSSADDAEWMCFQTSYALNAPEGLIGCDAAIELAIAAKVPVPAAFWLFGSALGAVGWWRRRGN